MGILRAYKRLRHSRGYGVHSPSAYRLVREVIRPARGYGYYAEDRLPRLKGAVNAGLLFRMAVYLQPASVCIVGAPHLYNAASAIIRAACPEVRLVETTSGADLLLCFGKESVAPGWRHGIFAAKQHPALKVAVASRSTGHLLKSRRAAILIDRDVPFQITEISF